jgi:outer membrane biosynthesis protein TonB
MAGHQPKRVWAFAAAVSLLLHVALLGLTEVGWSEAAASGGQAAPSRRDVRFLLDALQASLRDRGAVTERIESTRRDGARVKETVADLPRPSASPPEVLAPPPPPRNSTGLARAEPASASPKEKPKPPAAPAPPRAPPREEPRPAAPPAPDEILVNPAPVAPRVEKDEDLSLPLDARLYVQRLKQRIERNIRELLDLSPHAKTLRGRVVFHLLVHRSGALMELQYVEHAAHPVLNVIAEQAIRRSDPFQPFYASMKAPCMLRAIAVRY